MDEYFKDTMIAKTDQHDNRLSDLESKIVTASEMKEDLEQSRKVLAETKELLTSLPISRLQILTIALETNTKAHQQPQEIKHHHHLHWVAYVAGGLFLLLCLFAAGWYMTAGKLDDFVANDTKYRYLKLSNSIEAKKMIHEADSIFRSNDDLRDWVLIQEENRSRQVELAESIKSQQQKLRSLQRDTALSNK